MPMLPRKIRFRSIGKEWRISYSHSSKPLVLIEFTNRKLLVTGTYSKQAALRILTKWVKISAKEYLTKILIKQNRKIKVKYKKLRIHSLKMEWGSYTTRKQINLHYKLIFLPPALVQYIMIHELCHIRHLEHSSAFWKEVAKYDKQWKRHKAAMEEADNLIPQWLTS